LISLPSTSFHPFYFLKVFKFTLYHLSTSFQSYLTTVLKAHKPSLSSLPSSSFHPFYSDYFLKTFKFTLYCLSMSFQFYLTTALKSCARHSLNILSAAPTCLHKLAKVQSLIYYLDLTYINTVSMFILTLLDISNYITTSNKICGNFVWSNCQVSHAHLTIIQSNQSYKLV
jgi:hypothetical protein